MSYYSSLLEVFLLNLFISVALNHIKLLDSFKIRFETMTPAGYRVFESRNPGNIDEEIPVAIYLHGVLPV